MDNVSMRKALDNVFLACWRFCLANRSALRLQLPGSDMVIDDYEAYNNDRSGVVDINPDDVIDENEPDILADDCT